MWATHVFIDVAGGIEELHLIGVRREITLDSVEHAREQVHAPASDIYIGNANKKLALSRVAYIKEK